MGRKIMAKRALPMALAAAMIFTSVPVMAAPNDLSGHWAEKVMTEWQEKGLIKGYEDGSVKPDNAVSRAEFVIMMNNALGLKGSSKVSFTDVKEGDWYYNAVATAVEAGYCKGYDDGTFKPSATITRAEAAIMTANAAGLTSNAAGAAGFVDAAVIPAWAKGSVGAVVEAGFMSGYPDGTFGAAASIKRAEAVSSLNRVMGSKADTPVVPEEEEKTETDNKKGSGGGGGGSSSGGGSGSGGGTTPTVPTVTTTVDSAAKLDIAIEDGKADQNLVINVTAALNDADIEAEFDGKELTINFNDFDMTGKSLKISAPDAEKITLNDTKDGTSGTEVGVLTIDAPNAEVVSYVVADTVNIDAVKYGTFHAKDKVEKIEIKQGAVKVDEDVAEDTEVKVTVPEGATGNVKIEGKVNEVNIETTQEVALDAEVTTANVKAEGATVTGEGSVETANVSAAATIDTKAVAKLDVTAPVTVTVGENATVDTVVVSAEAAGEAKTEISGSGTVAKIEAEKDVTVSATNVAEVEVGSGVTAELKADVEKVTVPATVTEAPTIKVEEDVTVDTVTTEAHVNVTGSGSIKNVTVSGSENVTITAPEDSAIKVDSVVNTGSGNVEINNESKNEAELPSEVVVEKAVVDTVETVNIDLATSDEWRTDGYVYEFFDISFIGAEWAVEELDWENVTYWVNGEQFQWIPGESVVGDYAVEVDMMDYSYDADTNTGHATGLIAAYEANVEAGETYKGEIRFPSSYLKVEEGYAISSGEIFAVDFDVTITEAATELTPAKDTLDEITIDVANADEWITEGYVYVEKEITFDGAEWYMEPYWEEHVTYWIDGEQFQWIPGESVVGDYAVEVEMVPEYNEAGNLSMKAMVFAYVENVKDGDSFDMEIKVPTYSLTRTDNNHRITRNETAVIDFTVNIEGCEDYVAPVVDTVEDINIDLSASDEWRTEGYLYQMFDITFNAAEFAVEELDWDNITYWVNGDQFAWTDESQPGDFAVEADVFDYSYDEESETGYAPGLIAAFVENVAVDEVYEVEIHFPSNQLRITEEGYEFKNGETVVVDFNVHIVDSEEELEPAKDTLDEITIDLETADEWLTEGYVYVEEEITFDAARWTMEPYWAEHVTYWIDDEQFIWDGENDWPGKYDVEVDMVPEWDDEGNMTMKAMVFAYVENVADGDSFEMEIKVPTYSLERTDDNYRITRNETAVIDFTVNITGSAPVVEDFYAEVTDTVIDCKIDNDEGTVTEGTITVDFAFENYTEAVRFGLMNDDGETATEKVFTRENADDTTGSVTFNMAGRPATKYEVVYQIGEEWYRTGKYVYLVVPEDAFAVTKVTGTEVHCSDNGEMVESGTITVTFTFKNYADAVKFGLMEHCDNDEDIVATEATYTRANESETEGSVTFAMTGVPVANYEVVYYLADVDKWVGTNEYIDLTKTDEPVEGADIGFYGKDEQVGINWDDQRCEKYTWVLYDSTGDDVELQYTKGCETGNIMPIIPRVDSGSETYDFVLYECDTTAEDWIGKELGRLEDAIVVTVEGDAIGYTMKVTDAANGTYEITLDETPENGDLYLYQWARGKQSWNEAYSSDGNQNYTETSFINAAGGLKDGDVYDLRKVFFDVADTQLSVTMTPASEKTYTVAEGPANEVNFTLNEDFSATWNGVEGYSAYRIDIGDNIIWVMDETTKANNLLSFIPCADDDTTYDIVLKGLDENYKATELARLEDALEVTVSGSAVEYTAVFGETSVNVTWTAEGIGEIHEVRNSDGTLLSVGGGSVTPTHTINYNNNYTVANGDVLDMRVVTDASLDGQVLSATITPASEKTYVVEDEPTTGEMSVDVTLNTDTVVVNPVTSPYVEFNFENLTEATTVATYVVTTEGASEEDAIETKTQDVPAGTKYATIGLYSATFAEVGTYYVYYKVGDGNWCETPLTIEVTEPTEPKVELEAKRTTGTVGQAVSKDMTITLKNDSFKTAMTAGTDVTGWFTDMPENWTATVKEAVSVGDTEMTVTIACAADKTVVGKGYIGLTVPADVLTAGNALTAMQTIAYEVTEATE